MDELTKLLRTLRGETSLALTRELLPILIKACEGDPLTLAAQVESTLVSRGLSLIVQGGEKLTAWIYLSRKEIPGYIPIQRNLELQNHGWTIANDVLGAEFAFTWKCFDSNDLQALAEDICRALEFLGAPQKNSWKLSPVVVTREALFM